MELSQKFKKIYWIVLICFLSIIQLLVYLGFLPKDDKVFYILFILWIILLLLPLFSEVSILGFKVKQEIKELKDHVDLKMAEIKTEIRTKVSQQVNVGYGSPPPDNKIPELEAKIKVLEEKYDKIPRKKSQKEPFIGFLLNQEGSLAGRFSTPPQTLELFVIRFTFEKLITQIWESEILQINDHRNRNVSPSMMLLDLHRAEFIDDDFFNLTREILSICNYAVHSRPVTEKQIDFVIKNAKVVYDSLYELTYL